MSLHDDLCEQARHLAMRDPRRPKQANLRRALAARLPGLESPPLLTENLPDPALPAGAVPVSQERSSCQSGEV